MSRIATDTYALHNDQSVRFSFSYSEEQLAQASYEFLLEEYMKSKNLAPLYNWVPIRTNSSETKEES